MGRGLSHDEKRTKLLEIFHESKDFYQLKELEKLGPKLKGIVSQSVKEVLQSLVDDGLVQSDKIGSSNFFWAFPSARGSTLTHKINNAREEHTALLARQEDAKASIEAEKRDREDTVERRAALSQLAEFQTALTNLKAELSRYSSSDPVQIEAKRKAVKLAKEAAFRYTDNVSILVSYVSNTFTMNSEDVRNTFGVPSDFDDLADS
ncbi:hypothetical protein BOTBODRAFT_156971 [Botryobasidium botryosum FD-172 SS1]|uniref:Meiotic nuclear division protein 1 n=1 Tax=Botryobasidium botryosum (strain FD-172 SS1) TaxID=930990 RepID=A0A067MPD5_BOTB1|nr:hypothetical protein BOTBODRAFT_156971 [Botryobasidium botryosum FD-172 SS1]